MRKGNPVPGAVYWFAGYLVCGLSGLRVIWFVGLGVISITNLSFMLRSTVYVVLFIFCLAPFVFCLLSFIFLSAFCLLPFVFYLSS